jgi:transcriptional regulator with XRE-family HTH domain
LQRFGAFVTLLREAAGLSRPALAAQADVSYSHLANLERGVRRPSADVLRKLAPSLQIDGNRLIDLLDATQIPDEDSPDLHWPQRGDLSGLAGLTVSSAAIIAPLTPRASRVERLYAEALREMGMTLISEAAGGGGPDFVAQTSDGRIVAVEAKSDTTRRGKVPRTSRSIQKRLGIEEERRVAALRKVTDKLQELSTSDIELLAAYAAGLHDASRARTDPDSD